MLEPFWKLLNRIARMLGVHTPPGPYAGLWSWKYLDKVRTARMVMSKRVKGTYRDFPDRYPPGSEFPQITLETTDGRTIDTRAFRGQKHFVLFTGAIT
jgi:hypothetical protein